MRVNEQQRGQAMTEMLVASSFVLVPLFLIIPAVGKYIDIQQAAVSAARYSAWQETVEAQAVSEAELQNRVFASAEQPLSSIGTKKCNSRSLWKYHNGTDIVTDCKLESAIAFMPAPSIAPEIVSAVQQSNNQVASAIGRKFDVMIDHESRIYNILLSTNSSPEMTTLQSNSRSLLASPLLTFNARSQVYAVSAWSKPTMEDVKGEVEALVPTKLFNDLLGKDVIAGQSLQDLMAGVTLSPELRPNSLEFGKVDLEVLPLDKYLQGQSKLRQYNSNKQYCTGNQEYCREP